VADDLIQLDEALLDLENLVAQCEPSWSRYWKEELANDLAALLKSPEDPNLNADGPVDKYPPELRAWHYGDSAELWHRHQKASLFLRLEMEERRLSVYVRDPGDGQILQLLPEDWMPRAPKDRLSGDFLESTDYGVLGSDGTRFYAQLTCALVHRAEFNVWLSEQLLHPSTRAKETAAVKRAVYELWDGNPPPSLPAKIRDRQIREWLAKNGYKDSRSEKYSTATIKRALDQIRKERLALMSARWAR
jgi:hypothetical protein